MPATADFIPATDATIQTPDFLPAESVKVQGGQSDFIPAEQAATLPKDTSEATQGFDVAPGQKLPIERQSTGLAGVGTKLTYDKLPGTVFENRPEGLVETPESAKGAGRNKPLAIPHPQSSITGAARDYTNDVEAEAERVNVAGGARNPFHVMSEQGGTVAPKALDANATPQEVSQRYQKAKAYLSSEADKIIREGKAYDPAHLVGVDRNKLAMQEAQFRLDEMAKEHVKANPVGATTQGFYSAGQGISQLPQQAIGAAKAAFMDQDAIAERNREAQAAEAIARARREEHPFATSLGFAAGRAISPEMLTTMLAGPVSALVRPAVMTAQGEAEKAATGQPLNPVRGLAENYAMVGMGGVAGSAARGLSEGGTAVQQAIARGAGHAIGGGLGGVGVAAAAGQNDQEALAQGIAGAGLSLGAGAHDIAEPIKAHAEHVAELGKRYPDLTVPERHALAANITRATNQEATNAPTPSNENGGASGSANGNDGNVSKPRSEGAGENGAAEPVAVPQPTPEEMRPSEFGGYNESNPGGLTHADAFPKAAGASLEAPAEGRGEAGGRHAAGDQTPEEGAAKAQSQAPAPVPQADHAGVKTDFIPEDQVKLAEPTKEASRAQAKETPAPKPAVSDTATTPETVKEPAPPVGTSKASAERAAESSGKASKPKAATKKTASDTILAHAEQDGVVAHTNERMPVHPDTLEGLSPAQKRAMNQNASAEDDASNITADMNAAQRDRYERAAVERTAANRAEKVAAAVEHYKNSPDSNLRKLAAYADAEGTGPKTTKPVESFNHGDEFDLGNRHFRVEVDGDGHTHFIDTDIEIPYAEGTMKINAGSLTKAPTMEDTEFVPPEEKAAEEKPNIRKDIPNDLISEGHQIDEYRPGSAVKHRGRGWIYTEISGRDNQRTFETRAKAVEGAEQHRSFMQDRYDEKIDALPERTQKTTGPQGSLLGERHEGSSIGSKTAGMFGNMERGAANELEARNQREAADAKAQVDKDQTAMFSSEGAAKPDPFANTKAAIKKAMNAAKKAPNPLSGVGLGGLSDVLEHATNISVAVVKDLATAGKHGFDHFVKAISQNIADPRLRAMMLFGERDKTTGKMVGGARDLYNAAREHPDITAHGIDAAMTPADKLPNSMLIAGLAKRTPEQVAAHEAERKAADAMPARPLTEKQTLRAATIEPTETAKGTIARTTGMSDESPSTTEAEALAARLKGEQKASATGFKLGQKTDTPAESNERITNTIIPPEEKVDVGKAIRASMTIRAKAEAAIAKLKDTAELSQAVKDQITGFAKELPRDIRADFLTDIKNGKTPADLRRSLARMDTAIEAYNARNALSDLYDTIGKPAKPKGAMPEGKTLAQKINADLVSKPEDPFASGKIDPAKLFPAARDGLSDLVGSLRTAGNPNATGAAKLADFIQSERDAGHSNDGGMTEAQIERLRGMEGKPVKSLSTEDRNLLTQAIRHAAHLGEQYNEALAGSRLRAVRDAVRSAINGLYHYHPEPLKAGSRAGGVEAEPRKNPLAQFMGNALRRPFQFLKLNFGKQGEKWWRAIVDSHTSVLGAKQSAADLVTSLMKQHGITDSAWRKMSETQRDIDLGDGQRIRLTPREVMNFYKQWGDSETARKMVRDGFVPDRLSGDPTNNKTITPASAQKIIDTMTPGEKAIADAIQKHFTSGKLHADANKESVNEFGYEKLTRPDYMPRSVAREQQGHGVPESLSNMQDRLLKDAGFLKERTGGNAPVVIRDIGDAFNEHVDKLSRFAYQNGPIRDVLMAANNPEFHAETLNRIGSGWQKTLTNFLRTAAGLHEPVTFPGSRLANDARSRLATGELFFRATSALNHFLGGMLSLNALPDGASSSFLKNFALRAFPNMSSVRDMEARDPYLRDRGEHGYAALDTPVDTPHAKGAVGRALDAVGNVGTAHIRLSDRLDSNAIYRTLTETYKKNNPGATEDAARNWAAHETGIIQRKTGTASTPLEHSEMSQNLSRIPVANMLSLFQTKTSAMRNVVDEAYHDWRADKSTQNASKFAKAAASVAFMTATYAGVGIAARALMHGMPITKDKKKEFAESEAINIAAHIADLVTPGIGGTLVRGIGEAITARGEFGGNLATDTINRVMQGIKRIGSDSTKGTTAKTIEDVAGLLNDLGKFIGVSAEQPTDIGYGIYHHMAGDIHTDKDRRMAEKEDNGFVKHKRPPRNNR